MENKCNLCSQEPIYLNGLCKKCWDLEQSEKLDRIEETVNQIAQRQLINGLSHNVIEMMNRQGVIPELFIKLNYEQRVGFLKLVRDKVRIYKGK